jgi:hypothetical protein
MPPRLSPGAFLADCPGGRVTRAAPLILTEGDRMTHLTYFEAAVVGLVQGISEMVPVSSLGHGVLIPAIADGVWARDLNVAAPGWPR